MLQLHRLLVPKAAAEPSASLGHHGTAKFSGQLANQSTFMAFYLCLFPLKHAEYTSCDCKLLFGTHTNALHWPTCLMNAKLKVKYYFSYEPGGWGNNNEQGKCSTVGSQSLHKAVNKPITMFLSYYKNNKHISVIALFKVHQICLTHSHTLSGSQTSFSLHPGSTWWRCQSTAGTTDGANKSQEDQTSWLKPVLHVLSLAQIRVILHQSLKSVSNCSSIHELHSTSSMEFYLRQISSFLLSV